MALNEVDFLVKFRMDQNLIDNTVEPPYKEVGYNNTLL